MRRAAKRDKNEEELIRAAEKLGAWVISISQPIDLIVCHRGRLMFVEVKGPKGKYTPAQKSFMAYCEVNKAPFYTWRTTEDVGKSLSTWEDVPF